MASDTEKLLKATVVKENEINYVYNNISQIECANEYLLLHPKNDRTHVLRIQDFEKIVLEEDKKAFSNGDFIRSMNDDDLAEWLCRQVFDDYGDRENSIDIQRYHTMRNFLKNERVS